jgi:glycerate dehydrogenase
VDRIRRNEARSIVDRVQEATVAICNKLPLREPELVRLPKLTQLRQTLLAGTCANADAGFTEKSRRLYARCPRQQWQQARQFCLLNRPIHDLHGSKLGIIGYGSLGQAVAALAESIGMQVLIAERKHATLIRE